MTASTHQLLDSIKAAFQQAGWSYSEPRPDVLECQFDAHHTRIALHLQCYEEIGAVSVVGSPAIEIAIDRLARGAELLMRNNLLLNIGNLELDWESGKVLFRATNIFPCRTDLGEVPQSLVHTAIAECDRITPQVALLNRDTSPAAALLDVAELVGRDDLLPPVGEEA